MRTDGPHARVACDENAFAQGVEFCERYFRRQEDVGAQLAADVVSVRDESFVGKIGDDLGDVVGEIFVAERGDRFQNRGAIGAWSLSESFCKFRGYFVAIVDFLQHPAETVGIPFAGEE